MPRGAKPKQYPDDLVQRIKELYQSGMTQHEVATEVGLTQKVVWNVMHRHGIQARVAAKRNQWGSNNHGWKGAEASYTALHFRVERIHGKPTQCDECGESDPDKRYEWANLTGRYDDHSDYKRMCTGCHRRLDAKRRKTTGKVTSTRNKQGRKNG